jgi:hypothetical protein
MGKRTLVIVDVPYVHQVGSGARAVRVGAEGPPGCVLGMAGARGT